ncbi:hypothetical protein [Micromonospora sp. CPCC 206061]|uniref:hypothetical protein n=1 Tax=Micromonospora sp. CPCC 206061 TaxID=3122410 RepID=UPI002FEEB5AB
MRGLVLAEWTKLRTVVGTAGCLVAMAGALVAVALLISSGNPGTYSDTDHVDEFRFVHRELTGDHTIVARVTGQESDQPWAMAGILVKRSLTPGAQYAALAVTPGHGVRMQTGFTTDIAGDARPGPRYLRLTRTGDTVTGSESGDGVTWDRVGTVTLTGLPPTVHLGLFVTSPGMTRVHPMRPGLVQIRPNTATFEAVRVSPAGPAGPWQALDVGGTSAPTTVEVNGSVAVTGSGDIVGRSDDGSRIVAATAGTVFAALPAIALGVLVTTSEYRWGLIRTTLAAAPRRGPVLAAKAATVAITAFPVALAATAAALLAVQPLLHRNGYRPPTYPDPSLLDPAVLRVVTGTAIVLTLLALLGLGIGALVRRSAGAITVVAAAVLVPVAATPFAPSWLQRFTPVAGLSVQQVRETDDTLLLPWAGRPWMGIAVLSGYTGLALAAGYWRQRRSDA